MSNLTEELKRQIDAMDYENMMRDWRFAPVGDPMFQGDSGKYYSEVMRKKRKAISDEERVDVSKRIGW